MPATAQVAVTADQDSVRAAKVTAVLIKRCRTVLTERCRYLTKNKVANSPVEQCLKDWLETLNTQAESTLTGYRIMVRHLVELIGTIKLVELKVRDVDFALGKLAKRLSTRSVRLARMILIQASRNVMATAPTGEPERSSRPLNLERLLSCWTQPRESADGHIALGSLLESKDDTRRPELNLGSQDIE